MTIAEAEPAASTSAPAVDHPRLRHCAFTAESETSPLVMIVGRDYYEITEEYGTRDEFFTVKRYLDGRHSIQEIVERSGANEESVRQIVEVFHELGLLHQATPMDFIPGPVFLEQVQSSCQMWGRQIGYHRLFAGLEDGSVRSEVLLGLVLETYHYVRSAPKHIATAIAHCDDERLVPMLSRYFTQEYNHAGMMARALQRMGLKKEHLPDANPMIGTWSLINNLCEIARQDTLAYLACTTLFEARAEDFEAGSAGLRAAAVRLGFGEDSVEPLITHMRIDVEAGHVGLLEEAIDIIGRIPADRAHRAVDHLHNLKHSYDQFHDNVLQFYSDIANCIPRLKVDYFSL